MCPLCSLYSHLLSMLSQQKRNLKTWLACYFLPCQRYLIKHLFFAVAYGSMFYQNYSLWIYSFNIDPKDLSILKDIQRLCLLILIKSVKNIYFFVREVSIFFRYNAEFGHLFILLSNKDVCVCWRREKGWEIACLLSEGTYYQY